jgi:DNA-binding CsgD family transcriptional regulator
MSIDRICRLTEAEREVLRLWLRRASAKEIARDLGITHWAVNERLRSARRRLGVASSNEAARLLADAEPLGPYNALVCDPPAIADETGHGMLHPSAADGGQAEWRGDAGDDARVLREEQAGFAAFSSRDHRDDDRPPTAFPRQPVNRMGPLRRLAWIGALAVGILILVAGLIAIAWGALRLFGPFIELVEP